MSSDVRHLGLAAALAALSAGEAGAQDSAELAKKLANPVASLISVPLQNNYDCCYGPSDGYRYTLNVQPVVPISIAPEWNLIVRTIVPIIHQEEPAPGVGDATGFGDTVQTFFFSPKAARNGLTLAAGPVFLWPTGGSDLSGEKWGAGPSALVLKQQGHVTMGVLANHLWSYAGDAARPGVSASFVQPFFTYTYPSSTALSMSVEATYDWKADQWNAPLVAGVSRVYRFGQQRVQLGAQGKVYLDKPAGGPDWGLRFNVVFLFPRR